MSWLRGSRDLSVVGRRSSATGTGLKSLKRRRGLTPAIKPLDALEARVLLSTANPLDTTIWTPVGPAPIVNGQTSGSQPVSGRITGVAGDPTNPLVDYIAAAGGGVWKTVDGGNHWTPLTDNQATLFMGAIAVAPSNGQVIYAGTGEANNAGDSGYGRGILVSQNGGASWTLTTAGGAFDRETVSRIAVDPTNPAVAYASVAAYAANGVDKDNTGIWKTTNYGASWTNTTAPHGLESFSPYSDVVLNPLNPSVIYAAIGDPGGYTTNGVIKSTDGGATWNYVDASLPQGNGDGNIKLAISPTDPDVLYASISNGFNGGTFGALKGVYRSSDAGATWTLEANTPNFLGNQGWYDNTIAVDPLDPSGNTLYAGGQLNYSNNTDAIVESTNGGASWFDLTTGADGKGPHTDHHAMAFDASGRLLDGNDGGVWRLDNNAQGSIHWTDLNNTLQTIQFTGIATDPSNPNVAYGGAQDNGTSKFINSTSWNLIAGGDGGFTQVDHNNPSTIYQEYTGASLQRSDNGGQSFRSISTTLPKNEGAEFYVPFILDPTNQSRVLAGLSHVYESTNRGDNFHSIGGDGSPGWDSKSTISTIAADGNTVYVATDDDKLLVTTNDGATWTEVSPSSNDHIKDITLDPTNPQVAYAVVNTFDTPHVLKTTNGGTSWADISANLPNSPTNAVTLGMLGTVPTLFVGTDIGVYSTPTASVSWTRLGTGFPNAQVVSLDYDPTAGLLAAGTHGRGLLELSVRGIAQTGIGAVIDNTTFGYRDSGPGWTTVTGVGVNGSERVNASASATQTATYTLTRPAGSTAELFTTWTASASNTKGAVYSIYDGATKLGSVTVNQSSKPSTLGVNGTPFLSLGTYSSKTGVFRVILSNSTAGQLVADEVYAATPLPTFAGIASAANGTALPAPGTQFPDLGTIDPSPIKPPSRPASQAVVGTPGGPVAFGLISLTIDMTPDTPSTTARRKINIL